MVSPLSYVFREFDEATIPHDPEVDFIETFIIQALLYCNVFNIDAVEIHTYLVNFISENKTAEVKMLPHAVYYNNSCLDYMTLQ